MRQDFADTPQGFVSGALTVEMALGLPSLRRGLPRVLAGRQNLDRAIRWAHSSEVPNIARLLKGGELLLMTGMGIGTTPAQHRRFIGELVDRRVAGLAIELGQVYATLPDAVVAECEAQQLPLIEFRREVRFVEITEAIHSTIISRQVALLTRGAELHRRLTGLMLNGADVPEILNVLAEVIGNPVVLEKASGHVLYHAHGQSTIPDVLTAWERLHSAPEHDEVLRRPIPGSGNRVWGHLVALPLNCALDDFDAEALERTVTLVALELLRSREEALLVSRHGGDFLNEVAAGRMEPYEAAATARQLGFDHRRGALLPMAVVATEHIGHDTSPEVEWAPVLRTLRDDLAAHAVPALIGSAGSDGGVIALLGLSGAPRRRQAADTFADAVRAAATRHLGSGERPTVAAGPAVEGWESLPGALRSTIETAALGGAAPDRPWHDATTPDVGRLLGSLRDDKRVREFATQRLGPVLDHDARRVAKLMPTLDALCANGWRKAETARELHLSRQALYPRLERLEKLLGASLEDPETRLSLELALRVHGREPPLTGHAP